MKKVVLIVLGVGAVTAFALYVSRPPVSTVAPESDSASSPVADEPTVTKPVVPSRAAPVAGKADPARAERRERADVPAAPVGFDATLLAQTVDLLVSPQASFGQKQAAWSQLLAAGKLDAAIGDLEQRMATDPRTAEYPAALGQAYLRKCATLQDLREQGILGMQADKVFDTALALDPSNWEARFTKAVAMSYWPAALGKGEEVIQQFQTLIQQQEAQPPQPQFAETYSWLGDQYHRAGQAEQARAVWERGMTLFPNHEGLKGKLASNSKP